MSLALILTGFGLAQVTRFRKNDAVKTPAIRQPENPAVEMMRFSLLLSDEAREVRVAGVLKNGAETNAPLTGQLELDPKNPQVAVKVRWKSEPSPSEHRFAKLTLEPTGQATVTHVFDAAGDIDEVFELPTPASK